MEERELAFLRWNDGIAGHFFKPEVASRPVVLFVDETVIRSVGDAIGLNVADFVQNVKEGPSWLSQEPDGICRKAFLTMRNWRERDLPFPPYIAYLALFVYAAGVAGDFPEYAYYPRLRKILGLPHGSTLPGYERMLELWDDLERWTVVDECGKLGLFEARITGKWIHVGVPLAQTVLSAEERELLPGIFAAANLDPESIPTNGELAQSLRRFGGPALRRRTVNVLQHHDDEMYEVLLDTVVDELIAWDGRVDVGTVEAASGTYSSLKLCLELEPLSGECSTYLRATLPPSLKDCTLLRTAGGLPERIGCSEDIPGWSMPLVDQGTGNIIDAGRLDWDQSQRAIYEAQSVTFRFQERPVRIFVDAQAQGLPGFSESYSLPGLAPFLLAASLEHQERIALWLDNECINPKQLRTSGGVPANWQLWSVERATGDRSVRSRYPWLRLPDSIRLRFRGGVRSSAGNYYFAFAPPNLEIVGYSGEEELIANSTPLDISVHGTASLQAAIGRAQHIQLEIRKNGEVVSRRALFFVVSLDFGAQGPCVVFDRWGEPGDAAGRGGGISGARISGVEPKPYRYRYPFEFISRDDGKFFLLGKNPGEVVLWPQEAVSNRWSPIWAVQDGLKAESTYIQGDEAKTDHDGNVSRERLRLWKEIVWHRRCRIGEPRFLEQRRQWKRLQRTAQHVRTG